MADLANSDPQEGDAQEDEQENEDSPAVHETDDQEQDLDQGRPELSSSIYVGQLKENERSVKVEPRLSIVNPEVELCDFELLPVVSRRVSAEIADSGDEAAVVEETPADNNNKLRPDGQLEFAVTWVDRVNGWAKLEAKDERSRNCERRQSNYTLRVRAVACNGLKSKE